MIELYLAEGSIDMLKRLKPTLNAKQSSLLNAFYRLSNERSYHHGPLALPESVIRQFATFNAISYPLDLFIHAITEIDSVWLKYQSEKIKRAMK